MEAKSGSRERHPDRRASHMEGALMQTRHNLETELARLRALQREFDAQRIRA
jgi:hypothetical protein